MKKMWGLRILLNALLVTNVTACKILISVDEDGGGTSPNGCVNVRADSNGGYSLPFAADGKLAVLRTLEPQPGGFLPTLFAGQFSGQGRVNNFEVCTNNICPMIAIAPARFQFVRSENDHKLNFGLYSLEEGPQGAVGHISFSLPGRGITPVNADGTVASDLCVERIEFNQNNLTFNEPIAVPIAGTSTALPGGSSGSDPGTGGGANPPIIDDLPIAPPYVQFGSFRGEVRIVTRNAGVIVLDDDSISPPPPPPPPPPPIACVEVPLNTSSSSYNFPFRAEGTIAIAEAVPTIGIIDGPPPLPTRFGFFEGKGAAYAECRWQEGRLCPMMPEIMPRYSFSRWVEQDHSVQLNFMDLLAPAGGNVSGFGRISISLEKVLKLAEPTPSPGVVHSTLCVAALEFKNSLSPIELVDYGSASYGKLSGTVVVHTREYGQILLTDPKLIIDPPVVTK